MKVSPRYHSNPDDLALELTMRDVLDGMEEMVSTDALYFDSSCMQILSIEAPGRADPVSGKPETAQLIPFPKLACSA